MSSRCFVFFVTNVFVSIDAEVLNEDVLGKAVFFLCFYF